MPLGGWGWLALSLAVYAGIGLIMHQPFHDGSRALKFFDLRVYIAGGHRVLDGQGLYRSPILDHLGFTYPPFAALLFVPLTWLPLWSCELLVTVLNLGLLVWLIRRTALIRSRAASVGDLAAGPCSWSRAAGLAAALVWLEPISVTLGYGQIDLLIAALVVLDISRPDGARAKGAAIGLAAGIKLTPLLFIPYLLLSGRRRAAAWATGVFAATVAISYLATGGDASRYWTGGLVLKASRIGNFADAANQSLQGVLSRLDPAAQPGMSWHLIAAAAAVAGVLLAVHFARRGDEAAGFSVAALTTLLVSPVSWTHHWTLAVPALLLLGRRARAERSQALARATIGLAVVGFAYLPERWQGHRAPTGILTLVSADPYVLVAVAALAVTGSLALRSRYGSSIPWSPWIRPRQT